MDLPIINSDALAIIISIISAGISGVAISAYFLSIRSFKTDAMLTLFNIINGKDVKDDKRKLADHFNFLKVLDENGNPTKPETIVTFENFKKETMNVMEAYNQVGALYELNLIDKTHFRRVYGENFVRTYKLSKDHIKWWRKNGNKEYCLHFENVAQKLMKNRRVFQKGINVNVYNDRSLEK